MTFKFEDAQKNTKNTLDMLKTWIESAKKYPQTQGVWGTENQLNLRF